MLLFFEQLLNGLQFGFTLFLLAAGLTLIFGIMGFINLAHGSFYMVGAYGGATALQWYPHFGLALIAGMGLALAAGLIVERFVARPLQRRHHLDQVLATFALILLFNELTRLVWGRQPLAMALPESLAFTVELLPGVPYPAYRLAIIATGALVALLLYGLIHHTRLGMLIRAGATHREVVAALGCNIARLNQWLFGLGALLAGLAGVMVGPLTAVDVGMGERILILTFVVIVIGGIGSVAGALIGALLVGVVDTLGRAFLPTLLQQVMDPVQGFTLGTSLASIAIYLVMALVLVLRPGGLVALKSR